MCASEENVRLRKQIQSLEKELRVSHSKQAILLKAISEIKPNLCPTDADVIVSALMQVRLASLGDAELVKEVHSMFV